jgi:small-conductance mechanosensitive channel
MPVPARSDLADTLKIARAAVTRVDGIVAGRSIDLFIKSVTDTSMTLLVRFWIASRDEADYLRARSEAIQNVMQAFEAHRITRKAS